ncbi:MAG: hypothetical protein M1449_04580 [Candidatus Thermoplasmatota archaeon]|nr:hypothetical protein [Candidatus Thermoplasmatota archaeon]
MRFIDTLCAIGCVLGLTGPSLAADAAAAPAVRAMVKVDPHARYKVVYDIHSAEIAAGVSKGLYYARGLIEAYGKQGVGWRLRSSISTWCCTATPRSFC